MIEKLLDLSFWQNDIVKKIVFLDGTILIIYLFLKVMSFTLLFTETWYFCFVLKSIIKIFSVETPFFIRDQTSVQNFTP